MASMPNMPIELILYYIGIALIVILNLGLLLARISYIPPVINLAGASMIGYYFMRKEGFF